MTEPEHRTYQVSGDIPPRHWAVFEKHLGNLGIGGQQIYDRQGSAASGLETGGELMEGTFVSRGDMLGFAELHGYSVQVARRVWKHLGRMFFRTEPNYKTPLKYQRVPEVRGYSSIGLLGGLQVESLAELLTDVDEMATVYENKELAREKVMGRNAGPVMLDFMLDFVRESLHTDSET